MFKKTFNNSFDLKRSLSCSFVIILFLSFALIQSSGQQTKSNENKADKNLKSLSRINPSTLAVEISVPFLSYPGRNGNQTAISIDYSSKVWTLKPPKSYTDQVNDGSWNPPVRHWTLSEPIFGDKSIAGWTSSLAAPRLKEKEIVFDGAGRDRVNYLMSVNNPLLGSLSTGNLQAYQLSMNDYLYEYWCGDYLTYRRGCVLIFKFPDPAVPPAEPPIVSPEIPVMEGGSVSESTLLAQPGVIQANPPDAVWVKRMTLELPNGSTTEFRKDDKLCEFAVENCGANLDGTYLSVDSSKMRLERNETQSDGAKKHVIYLPNGSKYVFNPETLTAESYIDNNGNFTNYFSSVTNPAASTITDTLGRTFNQPIAQGQLNFQTDSETTSYNLTGLNGGILQYQFVWKKLKSTGCETDSTGNCGESVLENPTERLYFAGSDKCFMQDGIRNSYNPSLFQGYTTSGGNEFHYELLCSLDKPHNPKVLAEILLPNGSKYIFKYNKFGEISKIIYPSGSYERFRYDTITPVGANLAVPQNQINRGVVERWISQDGATEAQNWKYNITGNPSEYATGVTIMPDNSKEVRLIHTAIDSSYNLEDARAGMPFDTKIYTPPAEPGNESSRTLVSRKLTEWIVTGPIGPDAFHRASRDPRPQKEISIIIDSNKALAQMTETVYDANPDLKYFASLNTKIVKLYKFVPLSPSMAENGTLSQIAAIFSQNDLEQTTEYDYLYNNSYLNRGISSLPIASVTKDKAGLVVQKGQTVYDELAYPLINTSTTIGWIDPNTSLRGKVTTNRVWNSADNSWIETHVQYDNFGNARKAWDAKGNVSEVEFSSANQFAYPTKTKSVIPDPSGQRGSSVPFETTTTYDFYTGLVLSTTDANGQTSWVEYNDPLLRPTKVIPPAGGAQTTTEYGDAPGNLFVRTRTQIDAANWTVSTAYFDGLGRTFRTQKSDNQGDVFTETVYDQMGRVKQVTNPFRAGETKQWSTTNYDAVGRVKEVIAPDGTKVTSDYGISTVPNFVGTVVVGTDQAGKQGRSITNALGQLIRVDEPDDAGNLGAVSSPVQPTYYNYDGLGRMVKVTQGVQNRYFLYDSLGRLLRVSQPEQQPNPNLSVSDPVTGNSQWTAAFSYDANGNLLTATDAKNVTISSTYDNLNRVLSRSYSDGTPTASYFYDNPNIQYSKGKLTRSENAVSASQVVAFDNLGRVLASQQITDGNSFTSSYLYNLSGQLVEETYPSGRKVKNTFEADGDLSKIETQTSGGTYQTRAQNFSYAAHGAIAALQIGSGLWETAAFNNRLQVVQLGLGTTSADTSLWRLNYDFGTTNNDGNIKAQTVTSPVGIYSQTFQYDSLDRLKQAQETANGQQTWIQNFAYDRYGNRTGFNQTIGGQISSGTPQVDANTNRFTTGQGYTYDFAGNIVQDNQGRQFVFNGDNKQVEVRNAQNQIIGQYFYDADGKRIKKVSNQEVTTFVYSGGKLVAEYSNSATPSQNPTTQYLATDMLGSPRVITDGSGNVISRRDFMPFGEDLPRQNYGMDNLRIKFTGYQKDNETGLDFAEARYYNNSHGRFTAVDPLLASGKSADPQTFNRYAYTSNNPVVRIDPGGTDWYIAFKRFANGWSAVPTWSDTEIIGGKRWGTSGSFSYKGRNYTYQTSYVFADPTSGRFATLDPFSSEQAFSDSLEDAQKAYKGFVLRAGKNAGIGAIEGVSLMAWAARRISGIEVNENHDTYKMGSRFGTAFGMIAAVMGGGAGVFAKLTEKSGAKLFGTLAKIYNKYPANCKLCTESAKEAFAAFKKAGIESEIVELRTGTLFITNKAGEVIGDTGFHQAVKVGDRYFDALTQEAGMLGGATWDEYIKLFEAPELIKQVPKSR